MILQMELNSVEVMLIRFYPCPIRLIRLCGFKGVKEPVRHKRVNSSPFLYILHYEPIRVMIQFHHIKESNKDIHQF